MEGRAVELQQALELFPTTVYQFSVPDSGTLSGRLHDAIGELRRSEPQGATDRLAGEGHFEWQSRADLQREAPFREVAALLAGAADQALEESGLSPVRLHMTECWANASDPGGSHAAHAHPNSYLSAVYFVSVPSGSGALLFVDPRPQAQGFLLEVARPSLRNVRVVRLEPEPGRIVVFPSWLTHRVESTADTSTSTRETIAANFMPVGEVGRPTMGYELVPPERRPQDRSGLIQPE